MVASGIAIHKGEGPRGGVRSPRERDFLAFRRGGSCLVALARAACVRELPNAPMNARNPLCCKRSDELRACERARSPFPAFPACAHGVVHPTRSADSPAFSAANRPMRAPAACDPSVHPDLRIDATTSQLQLRLSRNYRHCTMPSPITLRVGSQPQPASCVARWRSTQAAPLPARCVARPLNVSPHLPRLRSTGAASTLRRIDAGYRPQAIPSASALSAVATDPQRCDPRVRCRKAPPYLSHRLTIADARVTMPLMTSTPDRPIDKHRSQHRTALESCFGSVDELDECVSRYVSDLGAQPFTRGDLLSLVREWSFDWARDFSPKAQDAGNIADRIVAEFVGHGWIMRCERHTTFMRGEALRQSRCSSGPSSL